METSHIGRRLLLGFAAAVIAVGRYVPLAAAQTTGAAADLIAPIGRLQDALLESMKAGQRRPFAQRFAALAPVVDATFDLDAVLRSSVGLRWATLPQEQSVGLQAAFRRYTISSYVANFDSYSGQTFQISPDTLSVGAGQVIVQTRLMPKNEPPRAINYVMKETPSGWKAVDVLADGSISSVAVQRSDFRSLLASGGAPALIASLQRKVADLSGGGLA
jgi:phospholipid transport system substrate-binding protein